MTRANPNALRPGINFSSVSADVGTIGSPGLKPYLSDNIDLGLDWYTGREGYISATVFQKEVAGFTVQENLTLPFKALEAYGVTYANLIPNQQVAIPIQRHHLSFVAMTFGPSIWTPLGPSLTTFQPCDK